jgi:hypothetical protein
MRTPDQLISATGAQLLEDNTVAYIIGSNNPDNPVIPRRGATVQKELRQCYRVSARL